MGDEPSYVNYRWNFNCVCFVFYRLHNWEKLKQTIIIYDILNIHKPKEVIMNKKSIIEIPIVTILIVIVAIIILIFIGYNIGNNNFYELICK